MILKTYELSKINKSQNNLFLFYGNNQGFKSEFIKTLTNNLKNYYNYDEKDILENPDSFFEKISSNSLFEERKNILVKRASNKITGILEKITLKNLEDITIIINADNLEKKSKLRTFFEKSKEYICIAFYPDEKQVLQKIAYDFLKEKNISVSSVDINLIVDKCNGDRENLYNELNKIEYYCKKRKKINSVEISKLVNLTENHEITELIDNCLAKNKNRTISILNENNFVNEDCILITRIFLNKSKKILKLSNTFENNKNIDLTISSAKPPIFWKDKDITKRQILKWSPKNTRDLIYKINELELKLKKNVPNSVNLVTDFILEQSST